MQALLTRLANLSTTATYRGCYYAFCTYAPLALGV
jgi:hypothetical protein